MFNQYCFSLKSFYIFILVYEIKSGTTFDDAYILDSKFDFLEITL
jgi:hypothetical protein